MVLRTHARSLGLWMNGDFVGTWSLTRHGPDRLHYDPAWLTSARGRPLSLSLPFQPDNAAISGAQVRAYFENLLPDTKDIRERIALRYRTGSTEAFDLLAEIGRDCVGALEILPEGRASEGPAPLQVEPLSEARVAALLRSASTPGVMALGNEEEDFRISIAGAQEKTALLQLDGQWCVPHGPTPTTHIFKLPLGLIGGMKIDMSESVENEWLCSLILKAYGLPVATCFPQQFEDVKVLVVERFDRTWWTTPSGERRLLRLPQEDMCQATGVPPDAKYEVDGGPGMDRILALLDNSDSPEADKRTFFKAQLLFWMLCATDGHAKNFSIFHRPEGRFVLTPLYDVLSAYPVLGEGPSKISAFKAKMAMAVRSKNAHWKLRDIQRRHWVAVGARHGVVSADGRSAEAVIDELVEQTPQVIEAVLKQLPAEFPMELADGILHGLRDAARRLVG